MQHILDETLPLIVLMVIGLFATVGVVRHVFFTMIQWRQLETRTWEDPPFLARKSGFVQKWGPRCCLQRLVPARARVEPEQRAFYRRW